MTRSRRSLYTLGAAYLQAGAVLAAGLITAPLLLQWLGPERLGLTRVAVQWFGYSQLLALGLDAALVARMSKAVADGQRAEVLAIVRGGLRAYLTIAFGSAVWVLLLFLGAPRFFNLNDPALLAELRTGLLISAAGQIVLLFSVFKPLADVEQRGYTAQLALTAGTLCGASTALLLAAQDGGLPGQFFALLVTPLIAGLILAGLTLRRYPALLAHPAGAAVHGIQAFPLTMLVYQLTSRVSFISDNIFVAQILGPSAVAPFYLTQNLLLTLGTIVFGIGSSTWASLIDLYHRGQHGAFALRLLQLTRFTSIMACAFLVPAAIWNRQFLLAWVGDPAMFAGTGVTFLAGIGGILCVCPMLWGWPLITTGRVRRVLPYLLVGCVVYVVVSVAGLCLWGLIGPPLGTIANIALVTIVWSARVMETEFGVRARSLLLAAATPWIPAVLYAVALAGLESLCPFDVWIPDRKLRFAAISATIVLCSAIFLAAALTLLVPAADRREWLIRFRLLRRPAAPEVLP